MLYEPPAFPKYELKYFQTIGKQNYYEIVGQEAPLSHHDKAKIVSHLCQAQPHLMPRWKAELKGKIPLGRNFVGISEDGKLLIRESDIPILVFVFDPKKSSALRELMKKMTEELSLNTGLILDLDCARLRIHGNILDVSDFLKISRFLKRLLPDVLVAHENSKNHTLTPRAGAGFGASLYNAGLALFSVQELKESVVFPLSSINALMEYFKLDYRFPYLGSLNNSQMFQGIDDAQVDEDFHVRIAHANKRLGEEVDTMLKSTDGLICKEQIPPSVIPKSKL